MHKLLHYWHDHVPIRVNLTLWYLSFLGIALFLFAVFLHTRIQSSLQAQTDTALRLAAAQVRDHVVEQDGHLVFQSSEELEPISADFTLRLVAPDGTVWDSLGRQETPFLEKQSAGYTTIIRRGPKRSEWRFYTEAVQSADGTVTGWLQVSQNYGVGDIVALLNRHLCFLIPFGLLLAGIGGFWLASRALRPIDQITRTAQAISTNGMQQRINYQGPQDEVGRLATTFDRMLDRLQAGFERERRFAGDAAHELRTPLTALKGRIGVTLSQARQPAEYQDTLHDLEQQVDRLIRLSSDLLLMTRLDHEMHQTGPGPIDLSVLLAVLKDQIIPLMEAKEQTLVETVQPGLIVSGNMDLLIRLFLNLFDNSIKYTPHGGTITVRTEKQTDRICVAVSDTGPGIAPEHLPHLFERFYRAESDRTRHYDQAIQGQGGAGLGLAIAQEIAHAHGGSLTVQSEPGKGSTFTVCLPLSAEQ